MSRSAIIPPEIEPTPIFEFFRGNYATELLTAAVTEFQVFSRLREESKSIDALSQEIGLAPRPATVLFTALRAMGAPSQHSNRKLCEIN